MKIAEEKKKLPRTVKEVLGDESGVLEVVNAVAYQWAQDQHQ